jgi:cytochrome bd ubiquinol oxidase subunit II
VNQASIWAEALWVAMGLGLVAYAVTGGADFGAGLYSLLARGAQRDDERRAVEHGIAPIWEANHVWLIFVIVVLFSAFPRAYAVIGIALHVPIGLALVGIVLRGAAFSFHAYGIQTDAARERWTNVFAWSSTLTPIALGLVVGGLSSGDIEVQGSVVTSGYFAGWATPFALLVGLFALALFALLSACYLAAETQGQVAERFRRRALVAEMVAGALALGVFLAARRGAPLLFENFTSSRFVWPLQLGTAALAGTTIVLLHRRKPRAARYTVAAQVALVIAGWGLAMDRHLVLPAVSIETAGSRPEVLPALAIALSAGALLLGPALYFLYRVFKLQR